MKYLLCLLAAILTITVACKSVNNPAKKNESFTLLDATSQHWTAGTPGGGSGTEYYFKAKIKTAGQLVFDSAWIDNKAFRLFISNDKSPISSAPVTFSQGDTITLRVSDLSMQTSKSTYTKPPVDFNGAALLGYRVKDKRMYFIIKEITKLPDLNRQ